MKARRPTGLFLLLAVAGALAALLLSPPPQPVQAQTPTVETHVWSATLAVGSQPSNFGYIEGGFRGSLEYFEIIPDTNFAGATLKVINTGYRVRTLTEGLGQDLVLRIRSNGVQDSDPNLQLPAHNYVLRVGDSEFTFHGTSNYDAGDGGRYRFMMSSLSLTNGQTIAASL